MKNVVYPKSVGQGKAQSPQVTGHSLRTVKLVVHSLTLTAQILLSGAMFKQSGTYVVVACVVEVMVVGTVDVANGVVVAIVVVGVVVVVVGVVVGVVGTIVVVLAVVAAAVVAAVVAVVAVVVAIVVVAAIVNVLQ